MKQKQLGKLHPQYDFFLNPYDDLRFTRCPKCGAKTGQRKIPLVIWVDPHYPVSLNYTCRYCKNCDLLMFIKTKSKIYWRNSFENASHKLLGTNISFLAQWKKLSGNKVCKNLSNFRICQRILHEFNQVLKFELTGYLPDQEQEPVRVMLPPGVEHQNSSASKGVAPPHLLIDNLPKAMALVEKMRLVLPITARSTKELVNALNKQGI